MKRLTFAVMLLIAVLLCIQLGTAVTAGLANSGTCTWQVSFSPGGGCTDAVVCAITGAKHSVLVQAYSFTSAPIAKALVDAHKRGVDVQVVLDKSQRTEQYSSADFLVNAGVPTWIDARHAIAHNKIVIVDSDCVVTGSFNFTKAAEEKNAENLLVLKDPALAYNYTANWRSHRAHSEVYAQRRQ